MVGPRQKCIGITKRERAKSAAGKQRLVACGRVWSQASPSHPSKSFVGRAAQTRMTLEATRMALKAKLADKGRLRPHEMIHKKMPDGLVAGLADACARRCS